MPNFAEGRNPYEFANPVTDFAYFAGRDSELEDIRYYLNQAKYVAQPVNLAIIGERASGKTSLLNMIDIEGQKAGLLTARINLNSGDADPINLFWKLYNASSRPLREPDTFFSQDQMMTSPTAALSTASIPLPISRASHFAFQLIMQLRSMVVGKFLSRDCSRI